MVEEKKKEEKEKKPDYDPKQIFFSLAELRPILKDWADRLTGGVGFPIAPPLPPTNFPDVRAKDSQGKPISLEQMLYDLGVVKPAGIKTLDLQVKVKIDCPFWMPEWVWFKLRFYKLVVKFVKEYCHIKIIDKKTGEEAVEKKDQEIL